MNDCFKRTESLIGKEALLKLKNAHVAIFGIGGVGSYTAEALARSGVGKITLIDKDIVEETNINRQLIALNSTIGMYKTEVMKERILDINPECIVNALNIFYLPENASLFDFSSYSYIVDAIDTVKAKISLVEEAKKQNIPIISSMGAGNKLDPTLFSVSDIYKTSVDPLSRVMRNELKKRGIKKLKVVFSTEEPYKPQIKEQKSSISIAPSSIAFVPSVCGLIIASEVIKDLIKEEE